MTRLIANTTHRVHELQEGDFFKTDEFVGLVIEDTITGKFRIVEFDNGVAKTFSTYDSLSNLNAHMRNHVVYIYAECKLN